MDGNAYVDYSQGGGIPVISKYGWIHMGVWTIVVFSVGICMCCVCSLSCFYNYRVFRTR